MQLLIVLAAILAVSILERGVNGVPVSEHCSVKFQESLKETMRLKKSCQEAEFRDCCQVAEAAKIYNNYTPETGVYDISNVCHDITPFTRELFPPMQARCDMKNSDGGWTVLIRRTPDVDTPVLFNKGWDEYENGFGNLSTEFWYGLKNMHCLTSRDSMEVQVDLKKSDGTSLVLSYGQFRIDGPGNQYTLHVSGQKQTGFDFLGYHNGMKFSTLDRDNDKHGGNCATSHRNGGWWFNKCYQMYLTDSPHPLLYNAGVIVYDYAELKVRPKICLKDDETSTCE
uniref:Fibrinogen-like molecule n=1 Tax=Suberites domuncula TaxID=55567 RepID=Q5W4Y8_SUBDO|nr:fibrinogen-like molecule [Suberites domuncula]